MILSVLQRAVLSVSAVAAASAAAKVWTTSSGSQAERWVREVMAQAEREVALAKQEGEGGGEHHLAVCLGLCTAARIALDDARIEGVTGVPMSSFVESITRKLAKKRRKRTFPKKEGTERGRGGAQPPSSSGAKRWPPPSMSD